MTEEEFHRRTGGFFKEGWPRLTLIGHKGFYEIDLDAPAFCTMGQASALIDHLIQNGLADHKQGWKPEVVNALADLARG